MSSAEGLGARRGRRRSVGGGAAGLEEDETRRVAFGLFTQTAHLCELLEAGGEKILTGGSGFAKLLQHFDRNI